jgi:mannose-6-phosphate isomerase-like protein (cupin superfamily)
MDHWHEIWNVGPESPVDGMSGGSIEPLEPPPGVIAWRIFEVPPDTVLAARANARRATPDGTDIDPDGFHQTATVDYIYILEGELTLRLDGDEIDLHPGDCVVQRATNHAWRNYGDQPARVLGVMIGLRGTRPVT